MSRTSWRVVSFDPAVPMTLTLVLDSDEPLTVGLVEAAAEQWGVELERLPSFPSVPIPLEVQRRIDADDLSGRLSD